jgi:hypothetical protein
MAQQQEQTADVSQPSNSSPAVEASIASHNEVYTPPTKTSTDTTTQDSTKTSSDSQSASSSDLKSTDQSPTGSDGSTSSSSTKSGNDALNGLDASAPGSDKTIFSPAEQAARQLRGVFTSAEMGIDDVEHGLTAQSVLHNGTHFDYQPGERADGLTSATRRLMGGGQELVKTFDGRDDHLKSEVRFDNKAENSLSRHYEGGRGPDGLSEESYKKTANAEESFRKYENRGDGLSSESYSNAIGVKQYERVFEDGKGPDGLLRDAKVKTADGSIDMELRKFDPKINKDGLAFESVDNEDNRKVTNRTFEGRADGLKSEVITLANGKSVSQKEFASGETQIKRDDAVFQLGENGELRSVTKAPANERKIDIDARLDEIKKGTSGPITADKADAVRRQFQNLTPEEIQLMKRGFDANNPDALGKHIQDSFSKLPGGLDKNAHRWAEVDGNLKRTGAPGEEAAISLRVGALEAQQAGTSGNRSLEAIQADTRRALLGSSENQRKGIDESLKKLYGDHNGGLKELYETGPGKALRSTDAKDFNNSVLDLATRKGVDARTPAEQADLLFKAHATGNIANFREVAGKEAITDAGRKHFAENGGPAAIDQQVKTGRSTSELYTREQKQELKEIAKFGKESELTAFKKGTGYFKNTDDALADATKKTGADPKQRAMYLEGRELARSGKEPETAQQKESADFYKDWQKAFNQAHILNKGERAKEYERNIVGPEQPKNLKESIAESKDQKGLVSALKSATPEEQQRLKTDTDYQNEIREGINKATSNPASRAASNLILDRHIQGKELSAADSTMIGALQKAANNDLSRHQAPREISQTLREGLKQDKDGSLAKELLGNKNFKDAISDAVGGEGKFHSLVKPLLETGAVPERQARSMHGVGTPDYFKETLLDATPKGLKHLNSPEGKKTEIQSSRTLTPTSDN